jgi:uncharacterized protein YjcR
LEKAVVNNGFSFMDEILTKKDMVISDNSPKSILKNFEVSLYSKVEVLE